MPPRLWTIFEVLYQFKRKKSFSKSCTQEYSLNWTHRFVSWENGLQYVMLRNWKILIVISFHFVFSKSICFTRTIKLNIVIYILLNIKLTIRKWGMIWILSWRGEEEILILSRLVMVSWLMIWTRSPGYQVFLDLLWY